MATGTVTGEQVKAAMIAAGIERAGCGDCAICSYPTCYMRVGAELLFDPGCWCDRRVAPPEPRSWQDAADWINMQTTADVRDVIAAKFGLS